jgi:DNA repair exonuclease SbcCD ATPase subunit
MEERIAGKSEQIAELDGEMAALKAESQMDSLGDYQAALEKRTRTAAAAEAKWMILADILPTEKEGDDALAEWEHRISAHLRAAENEDGAEFNADTLKRAAAEIESLEERRRQIQSAVLQGSRRLHSVEIKTRELGILESPPPCRTTQELDHTGALIDRFCERIERDQRVAQDALAICQSIDAEEKNRVSELFGPQSKVTDYVASVTRGRYESVDYDPGRNQVYLTTAEGNRIPADYLSGGAYDQLYLAVRISIATRLLADKKGFLILDDPFVKADAGRLESMMELLRALAEDGWQILYFSAKDEVEAVLSADLREGRVQLIRLDASEPAFDLGDGADDGPDSFSAQGELTLPKPVDDTPSAGEAGSQSIL